MNTSRRSAIAALIVAGLLWGTTVPLSKVALTWLAPGWLAFGRFTVAAAVLSAALACSAAGRARLRGALAPGVLVSGAAGYGGSVLLQNVGIDRTSVSSAALLIGATPVLVALMAAAWFKAVAKPVAWAGFAVSLAGVGLVAGGGGGGASLSGDGLILASLLLSAGVTVALGRLVAGRDPVAVTAVQFAAAAVATGPFAALTERAPGLPGAAGAGAMIAAGALAVAGTVLPFTLFAFGQARIPAEVAGAFLNIEPLVGAAAGVVVFGNPFGPGQILGGTAILAGIALSSLPLLAARSRAPQVLAARLELVRAGLARVQAGLAQVRQASQPALAVAGSVLAAGSRAGTVRATAGPVEPTRSWTGPPRPAAGSASPVYQPVLILAFRG